MTFTQKFKDHTTPLYAQLKILKVKDSIAKKSILFVHDYFNKMLPIDFNDFFILDKDKHSYEIEDIRLTQIPEKYKDYILTEPNMQPQENPVHFH